MGLSKAATRSHFLNQVLFPPTKFMLVSFFKSDIFVIKSQYMNSDTSPPSVSALSYIKFVNTY